MALIDMSFTIELFLKATMLFVSHFSVECKITWQTICAPPTQTASVASSPTVKIFTLTRHPGTKRIFFLSI